MTDVRDKHYIRKQHSIHWGSTKMVHEEVGKRATLMK